jgi:hypothetical protein
MTTGSVPWYAVNSVFAPRAAAQQLMSESDVPAVSLRLALIGFAASFLSAWLINAAILAYAPAHFPDDHFLLGQSQLGVVFEALVFATLALAMIGSSIFVWKFLLRFRSPEHGALAAAALTLVLSVIVSPVQEVAYALFHVTPSWVQYLVFAATLLVGIGLPSFYYAEIFQIGMARSVVLNVCVFLMLAMVIIVVLLLTYFIFVAGDETLSGLVSWLLT